MESSLIKEVEALLAKHGIGSNYVLTHEIAILILEHEKETLAQSYKGFIESLEKTSKDKES